MPLKITTIVGARPQFIKAAALSRVIREQNNTAATKIYETVVHTGQHFDENMSGAFFEELSISTPAINLGISGLSHGAMTGRMLESIDSFLQIEKPNMVLVYGDTNSTIAASLAASKLHIPIAHIEAGLRSFNTLMPEEINRMLTDKISSLLFCPTVTAVENLKNEGVLEGVHNVGDVMYDVYLYYKSKARSDISLITWGVEENSYVLCTIHRAENTDNLDRLSSIFEAVRTIASETPVVLPIHPRTRQRLITEGKEHWLDGVAAVEPVSYLEMQRLEMSASVILTDSGGIQKEAYFHRVPCITMRDETEWVETVELGWNHLSGANSSAILKAYQIACNQQIKGNQKPYGSGQTAQKIHSIIQEYL